MSTKRYWKSLEDARNDPDYVKATFDEFGKDVPIEQLLADEGKASGWDTNRRDFLKLLGFSVSAATLAACTRTPVKYAIPYFQQPDNLVPSIPNWYASSVYDGLEFYPVLVKTREGRPIKLEGNKEAAIGAGGLSARAHGSILPLYDRYRQRVPTQGRAQPTWEAIDKNVPQELAGQLAKGKRVVVLTGTQLSPSTQVAIESFRKKFGDAQHVQYDAVSASGLRQAHAQAFGAGVVPDFRFDKAEVIVSVAADFLGTWLAATHYTRQYAQTRSLTEGQTSMSRHYQFESMLSLSGANADYRAPIRPSQEGLVLANLYNMLAQQAGQPTYQVPAVELAGNLLKQAATDLWKARGKALVVAGSNDVHSQLICCGINSLLEAYGQTIDLERPWHIRQGDESALQALTADMKAGRVGAILIHGTNPGLTHWDPAGFTEAMGQVPVKIYFGDRADETGALCEYILPDHHYLENWGDAEPQRGWMALQQPAINPLFQTRAWQESLLRWSDNYSPWLAVVEGHWVGLLRMEEASKEEFKNEFIKSLERGFHVLPASETEEKKVYRYEADLGQAMRMATQEAKGEGLELVLYSKVGIGDGTYANVPWLQELPDPITKATWDNYVTVNVVDAKEKGIAMGDVVKVTAAGHTVELPAYVLPGQARGTLGIALGYGRKSDLLKAAAGVGANAYPFAQMAEGTRRYSLSTGVSLEKTGRNVELALTQNHQTMMGRDIVRETNLATYVSDKEATYNPQAHSLVSLWPAHPMNGVHWVMAIDLNKCTGCGACVVSCQAENNISVVGREEVRRSREMHWLRIDRYFSSGTTDEGSADFELGAENPEVVFQPMLCQQCANAPCETVCPVLATTHSNEGLNQMTYNRCVGTRYCANNCPYKVRRFNWLDYTTYDDASDNTPFGLKPKFSLNPVDELGRLVLNPDVTVRARGVMEKCTFCVQRLQAAKLEAKKAGRRVKDEEVQTACQQSCPAGAITFGDINDPDSQVSKMYPRTANRRAYHVLEDVKTLPGIAYMVKVRNQEPGTEAAHTEAPHA